MDYFSNKERKNKTGIRNKTLHQGSNLSKFMCSPEREQTKYAVSKTAKLDSGFVVAVTSDKNKIKKKKNKLLNQKDPDPINSISNDWDKIDLDLISNQDHLGLQADKKTKSKLKDSVDIEDSGYEATVCTKRNKVKKLKKHKLENSFLNGDMFKSEPSNICLQNNLDTSLSDLNTSKKKKKKLEFETSLDIRDSECEMTVYQEKKKKRKKNKLKNCFQNQENLCTNNPKIEEVDSITNCSFEDKVINNKSIADENHFDIPERKKKKKKWKNLETIDSSNCDVVYCNEKSKIKKSKKNKLNNSVQNEDCESKGKYAIDHSVSEDNSNYILEQNRASKSFEKKKRKMKHLNYVDIRDSDCEMATFIKKKKKKKHKNIHSELNNIVSGENSLEILDSKKMEELDRFLNSSINCEDDLATKKLDKEINHSVKKNKKHANINNELDEHHKHLCCDELNEESEPLENSLHIHKNSDDEKEEPVEEDIGPKINSNLPFCLETSLNRYNQELMEESETNLGSIKHERGISDFDIEQASFMDSSNKFFKKNNGSLKHEKKCSTFNKRWVGEQNLSEHNELGDASIKMCYGDEEIGGKLEFGTEESNLDNSTAFNSDGTNGESDNSSKRKRRFELSESESSENKSNRPKKRRKSFLQTTFENALKMLSAEFEGENIDNNIQHEPKKEIIEDFKVNNNCEEIAVNLVPNNLNEDDHDNRELGNCISQFQFNNQGNTENYVVNQSIDVDCDEQSSTGLKSSKKSKKKSKYSSTKESSLDTTQQNNGESQVIEKSKEDLNIRDDLNITYNDFYNGLTNSFIRNVTPKSSPECKDRTNKNNKRRKYASKKIQHTKELVANNDQNKTASFNKQKIDNSDGSLQSPELSESSNKENCEVRTKRTSRTSNDSLNSSKDASIKKETIEDFKVNYNCGEIPVKFVQNNLNKDHRRNGELGNCISRFQFSNKSNAENYVENQSKDVDCDKQTVLESNNVKKKNKICSTRLKSHKQLKKKSTLSSTKNNKRKKYTSKKIEHTKELVENSDSEMSDELYTFSKTASKEQKSDVSTDNLLQTPELSKSLNKENFKVKDENITSDHSLSSSENDEKNNTFEIHEHNLHPSLLKNESFEKKIDNDNFQDKVMTKKPRSRDKRMDLDDAINSDYEVDVSNVSSTPRKNKSTKKPRSRDKKMDSDDETNSDYEADVSSVSSTPRKNKAIKKNVTYSSSDEDVETSKVSLKKQQFDTSDIKENLQELKIKSNFHVCPLHRLLHRPSRPLASEFEAVAESGIPVKSGRFTKAEDDIIEANWNKFLKEYKLNVPPQAFFKFPKILKPDQRILFLKYIAQGLNDRFLHRVHCRFKAIFQKDHINEGRFTKKEDRKIIEMDKKRKVSDVAKILNRRPESIYKRLSLISKNTKNPKRIIWNISQADTLVNYMLEVTKCKKIKHLKNFELTPKMWRRLSRRMDYISIERLKKAWKLIIHPRIFLNINSLSEVKQQIVDRLYASQADDYRTVDWNEIATNLCDLTPEKVYNTFKHLVYDHVPKNKRANLRETVCFLREALLHKQIKPLKRKIPKWIYVNGHLKKEK